MEIIDLRSDTTTRPTQEMLDAMYHADVGEDHYGEDPTANALHELAARKIGKEAALFMPTGTMSNQVAILTHCRRGDEMICDSEAHTFIWERGGPAMLASVLTRPVPSRKGVLDAESVQSVMRAKGTEPRTGLLWLENTHCWHGGTVTPLARMQELCQLAHKNEVPVHVDGARIFNAALALGIPAAELVAEADSVTFCLSKGLCCAAGSILAGNRAFIEKAKYYRRLMGGQMRQVGYFAAAGIVALNTMIDRMQEDHAHARMLAQGLKDIPGLDLDLERVQTNMVIYDVSGLRLSALKFCAKLKAQGVLAAAYNDRIIRMMPTRHTTTADVKQVIEVVKQIAGA